MTIPVDRQEDEMGKRWDSCLTDGLMKIGGGLVVGGVSSLILFRRRKWPIVLGSGFGFGLAYGNCERELRGGLSYSPASQRT